MKIGILVTAAVLSISLFGCSKNKCKLDTDGKKQAFGQLADMTHGAFSCDVDGAAAIGGMVDPSLKCEIGAKDCIGTMNAIHAAPATVKDVAAAYKTYLEGQQYKVEQKTIQSKFANGKDIEGIQLDAKNGDKELAVKVFPFGNDMVETQTMLAGLK
jgi:hypothetical protein